MTHQIRNDWYFCDQHRKKVGHNSQIILRILYCHWKNGGNYLTWPLKKMELRIIWTPLKDNQLGSGFPGWRYPELPHSGVLFCPFFMINISSMVSELPYSGHFSSKNTWTDSGVRTFNFIFKEASTPLNIHTMFRLHCHVESQN